MEIVAATSEPDIRTCVALLAIEFALELTGSGLTNKAWRDMETSKLLQYPPHHIGIRIRVRCIICQPAPSGMARLNGETVGTVVLRSSHCHHHMPVLGVWHYLQDTLILEDALEVRSVVHDHHHILYTPQPSSCSMQSQPNDLLIEYIAVAPHARGRGLGHQLLRWAECQAPRILQPVTQPAMCPLMTLWVRAHHHHATIAATTLQVASNNNAARALYAANGYCIVCRSSTSCCTMAVMRAFLGHPVWLKMVKTLAPQRTSVDLALKPPSPAAVTAHVTVVAAKHVKEQP